MDKQEIVEFFDALSADWDLHQEVDENKMNKILDVAGINENSEVLDVACGTGVMLPFYLERKVKSVLGIDISSEMINIAKKKFEKFDNVSFINADADTASFDKLFDCCMIYNAFPHFINPDALIDNLTKAVKPNGTLTIAHGMGRRAIDSHHSGKASSVSCGLMHEDDLQVLLSNHGYHNITKISTDEIYIVSGVKYE